MTPPDPPLRFAIGLNVAGGFSLRVINVIGLRAEAAYIQKGAGSEISESGLAGLANDMSLDPNTDYGITAGAGYNVGPLGSIRVPMAG